MPGTQVCANLKPSSSINSLWNIAKCFRKCKHPTTYPHNDDWFDDFCTKVVPCYIPSKSESTFYSSTISSLSPSDHCLSLPLSLGELKNAIFSRKSVASGIDCISPLKFQHLSTSAVEFLLLIFNKIIDSNQIPQAWTIYKVIPIPKAHSNNSFCPIASSWLHRRSRGQGTDSGQLMSPRVKSGNAWAYATRWRP